LTSAATTAKPCARRLDRRIERQQIGLIGDRPDQFDHRSDALGRVGQAGDVAIGPFCGFRSLGGDRAGALRLRRNLLDRRAQLLGRSGDRLGVAGGADRSLRGRHGFRRGGRCRLRQGLCGGTHGLGLPVQRLHHVGDDAAEPLYMLLHVALPPQLRLARFLRSLFQPLPLDRVGAEHIDGARHLADLVAAMRTGDFAVETPPCQVGHDLSDPVERADQSAADQKQAAEQRQHRTRGQDRYQDHVAIAVALTPLMRRGRVPLVADGERLQFVVEPGAVLPVGVIVSELTRRRRAVLLRQAHQLAAESDELFDALCQPRNLGALGLHHLCLPSGCGLAHVRQPLHQIGRERSGRAPVLGHVDAARFHHDGVDEAIDAFEMDRSVVRRIELPLHDLVAVERKVRGGRARDRHQPEERDEREQLAFHGEPGE
jgi:hypothetical protein